MKRLRSGGGWQAVFYTFRKAREAGGFWKFWKAMRSKNACKTCALGMGGQKGGMVNEAGNFPEVCKKSLQAMAADMQGAIKPQFYSTYSVPQLQAFSPRELESCGRLTQPVLLKKGSQYYQPISWEEALHKIVAKLKGLPANETFWYFSGRSSNEAGFLLQLFARMYGTNNVNNCSFYCHQASGVGLNSVLGTGTATLVLDDVEHADLVFVIGGNPASNHPRLMTTLKNIRNRGAEVIVINPIVETGMVNFKVPSDPWSMLFGTKIATLYVQPHIGGDLALLTGVAKRILEMGAHDEAFLQSFCTGWDCAPDGNGKGPQGTPTSAYDRANAVSQDPPPKVLPKKPTLKERLQTISWDEILRKSGVTMAEINAIAERYAKAENVVFSWTMGITHHAHGVHNVEAIANLALMRGMVGRPNAGLLPIRGHSNVQGIGSMGVTPKLKDVVLEKLQNHFGVTLPTTKGLDTLACMDAAAARELKFGFCLGGNLYGSNPDATFAKQSLGSLELLVYLNTTLNTGHTHGLADETIILPVLARDEEPEPTTQESMFNFIRLSDGGERRHEGPRSEIQVISAIARGVLGDSTPVDWADMENTNKIRDAISKIIPGWEQLGDIDKTKHEFQIPGRTFHRPRFPTPDGKARMQVHELPELTGEERNTAGRGVRRQESGDRRGQNGTNGNGHGHAAGRGEVDFPQSSENGSLRHGARPTLRLMTIRSEGQFNTVVYEDYDLYRGVDRRDVILLHPDDITLLGLKDDQRVTVRSNTGEMPGILVKSFDQIRAGNAAMYYPESNVLVPKHADPHSKTPAFKSIEIEIEATQPAVVQLARRKK
jgi:anaerobic selenocysteine-containing dehydrogenase